MIKLSNVCKDYFVGEDKIHALKNINIDFRDSEFVSILGSSGSGKTTLLNIIGGLDTYTSGDITINGESTSDFTDSDFDYYRNYSVGFIFQNYNLISHQTVLSNVEMALTLSGYPKTKRKKMAIKALESVGLSDQINKKPNQLSGGQMQRVAIARAIVNNPDIILADEPTGALDSQTSLQIMNLLKEISKDKLIVMVTHNPSLAEEYSGRIINLKDGMIISDSNPVPKNNKQIKQNILKNKRTQMPFKTALSLSLNNLMTKKTRTLLTSFAGSIGIIGIALIMSISSGMRSYISKVEEDTLSSYPITVEKETLDTTSMLTSLMQEDKEINDDNAVYSKNILYNMFSSVSGGSKYNDLSSLKKYLDSEDTIINDNSNAISYSYDLSLNIYKLNDDNTYYKTNPNNVLNKLGMNSSSTYSSSNVWTELLDNDELLITQYDVLYGHMPEKYNEVVLILDKNNQISDYTLYSLGIKDDSELEDMVSKIMKGEEIDEKEEEKYEYSFFTSLSYKLLLNYEYYEKVDNTWVDKSNDNSYILNKLNNSIDIKIVGIIKPNDESNLTSSYGSIGYLPSLTKYVIDKVNDSAIAKEQLENKNINVFTNKEFNSEFDINNLSSSQKSLLYSMSDEDRIEYISTLKDYSASTYEDNLSKIGIVDLDNPIKISIYPKDFESKDIIKDEIDNYNNNVSEDKKIEYTDLVGTIMSSVTKIVNIISYVLIAFVSISLVVSSIMIAIITYISVLERTKEIGILRAMGTSKKDIAKIFVAETFIEGALAGLIGVLFTYILNIPINILLNHLINVKGLSHLPLIAALALVIISIALNVIAGIIPSKASSKKDPAVVLRSE